MIYDRNLRTNSYKFKITDAKEITWEFKDFYQSSFDETQIANVSKKQVNLGSDLKIYLKQGFLPAFNKAKAYAESKNIIIVNNKELQNKTTVPIDINKIWFFTLEKSLTGNGSLYLFVNNETSFEQIKNEFKVYLENLILPALNSEPPGPDSEPPGPDSPPPVPGQGSPPPVPGRGSALWVLAKVLPPVPGQGSHLSSGQGSTSSSWSRFTTSVPGQGSTSSSGK